MRFSFRIAAVLAILASPAALWADRPQAPVVFGDYVEARTCDVWTGPCFSNSEINLRGDHAVIGWIVRKGVWNGVTLDSLGIVAAVDAEGTLTTATEGKVRTVLYVDERADAAQAKALIAMAAELAPRYVKNVVQIHRAPIRFQREGLRVTLEVGDRTQVKVATVPLNAHCDKICGNEEQAYPALSKGTHAECAKTLENLYRGRELEVRWSDPNARSAMVGTFAL